jgi:hypothetical protein
MNDYSAGIGLRKFQGIHVAKPTATLPQTAASALYTIAGGRVILMGIIGEVTVIMGATANNTKLVSNPTTGTSVDMCAVLATENDEVGCLYGITGLPSDALVGTNAGFGPWPYRKQVLPIGTIDLDCAGNNTGSVKWDLFYVPLDVGASVVSA